MGQGSPDNDRGYCAGAPCAFAQPPSECLANKRKPLGPPVTKRGACFCVRIRGSGEEPGANDRKPGQARAVFLNPGRRRKTARLADARRPSLQRLQAKPPNYSRIG